jgi:hypothetical protein
VRRAGSTVGTAAFASTTTSSSSTRNLPRSLTVSHQAPFSFRGVTFRLEVILAWPLLVLVAAALAWRRHGKPGGRGWWWFLAWSLAGFLMTFSFVTGFSIGLFILPVAAGALIWVALRSPHLREASGFAAGVGATALLVAAVAA